MSINSCTISGNTTRDAELRNTKGGSQVMTFTVAVNDRRKNPQTSQWEDVPNFIDCVMFGSRAEKLSTMIAKGTKVCVFGKLRWSQWESNGSKRSKVEVVADDIELMSRKGDSKPQNGQNQQQTNNYTNQYQSVANSAPQQPTGYYPQPHAPNADEYAAEYADETIPF